MNTKEQTLNAIAFQATTLKLLSEEKQIHNVADRILSLVGELLKEEVK